MTAVKRGMYLMKSKDKHKQVMPEDDDGVLSVIAFKVTPTERRRITDAARADRRSLSSYLRSVALDRADELLERAA